MSTSCRRCGGETICISMERNGTEFAMVSCSHCELRVWHVDGRSSELDGIIDRLASVGSGDQRAGAV